MVGTAPCMRQPVEFHPPGKSADDKEITRSHGFLVSQSSNLALECLNTSEFCGSEWYPVLVLIFNQSLVVLDERTRAVTRPSSSSLQVSLSLDRQTTLTPTLILVLVPGFAFVTLVSDLVCVLVLAPCDISVPLPAPYSLCLMLYVHNHTSYSTSFNSNKAVTVCDPIVQADGIHHTQNFEFESTSQKGSSLSW
jgi:hypothetical protein